MIFGFVWYSCGEKIKRWRRDERDLFRVLTRRGGGGSHRKDGSFGCSAFLLFLFSFRMAVRGFFLFFIFRSHLFII